MNEYKPVVFKTETEVINFIKSNPVVVEVDAFSRQLKELFFIQNHNFIGQDKEEVYKSQDFKKFAESKKDSYVHVYYPWNHHMVKCVEQNDYLSLKTNRNQNLISIDEQKKLRDYNVAVLGMSVGSNIAFVMTQAGISNKIIVADFDELDTTNLNRILAGVHQVGLNKTVVAGRRIYEDNPFADVLTLPDGINDKNLEELIKKGEIDCIIEEIDDMPFKIHTRILAIKYKIPVVMITDNGDGVVLHVERYDLGHNKIWGKDVSYFEKLLAEGPMTKDKAGKMIIMDIVGGPQNVDPKMMACVPLVISKQLVSWPQLGSSAILGGVVASYIVKQIALGLNTEKDIRAFITPESVEYSNHSKII